MQGTNRAATWILSLVESSASIIMPLTVACSGFAEGDGDGQAAATAAQTLSVWNQRLQSDYDPWRSSAL